MFQLEVIIESFEDAQKDSLMLYFQEFQNYVKGKEPQIEMQLLLILSLLSKEVQKQQLS